MIRPFGYILDYFILVPTQSALQKTNALAQYTIKVNGFVRILVWTTAIITWVIDIVSGVYLTWPLTNKNPHFWNLQLYVYPLVMTQLARDSNTMAIQYEMQMLSLISLALMVRPFFMLCTETYLCGSLTDIEKLDVSTCASAYIDNYVDAQSDLACANLANIDIASLAHGTCAYLIGQVAGMVQAAEFLLLFLLAYKDILVCFAMKRITGAYRGNQGKYPSN